MDARDLLRQQFQQTHQFLDMTVADCTPETLARRLDGSTIGSVGSIYAHVVVSEDAMVSMAKGGQPLLETGDWKSKTGIQSAQPRQDEEWQKVQIELPAFREYAQAVFQSTDDYLANASEADLSRELDLQQLGKQPAIMFVGGIGLSHVAQHWGEIAALKGAQGLKGLPF